MVLLYYYLQTKINQLWRQNAEERRPGDYAIAIYSDSSPKRPLNPSLLTVN